MGSAHAHSPDSVLHGECGRCRRSTAMNLISAPVQSSPSPASSSSRPVRAKTWPASSPRSSCASPERSPPEAEGHCDKCKVWLQVGPNWYHKLGTSEDLCHKHWQDLQESEQACFTNVSDGAKLGGDRDAYQEEATGQLCQANLAMQRENALLTQGEELRRENCRLQAELACIREETHVPGPICGGTWPSAEGRLRATLGDPGATLEDLQQAITGVEQLLAEANRELESRKLRVRRAAFEALHTALEETGGDGDDSALAGAVAAARAAGVPLEDVEKGEARLAELRSLSEEERAERLARELDVKRRREAFVLVKKDDGAALDIMLTSFEEEVRWQEWKDYAGRTLWCYARDLHAKESCTVLSKLLGNGQKQRAPGLALEEGTSGAPPKKRTESQAVFSSGSPQVEALHEKLETIPVEEAYQECLSLKSEKTHQDEPQAALNPSGGVRARACEWEEKIAKASEDVSPHLRQPEGVKKLRLQSATKQRERLEEQGLENGSEEKRTKERAFRAAAQNDCDVLREVLASTPMESFTAWRNKAGKDLLRLAEERGSQGAYSMIAKAMGIMKEMRREAFEDRESVWVYLQGEVQPRRATVLEDTPEEADHVLLEFWDGDDPPQRLERCIVRKMMC